MAPPNYLGFFYFVQTGQSQRKNRHEFDNSIEQKCILIDFYSSATGQPDE